MDVKAVVKIRGVVSLALLVLFAIVLVTGFELWLFAVPRTGKLHTITGFLMSGLVILHLGLNYRMFLNEVRALFRRR